MPTTCIPEKWLGRARCAAVACVLLSGFPAGASAQLSGTVTDSTSGAAVPGAVVTALDSVGRSGARVVTNERGEFLFGAPVSARRLRLVRMGFRPVEHTVREGARRMDVALVPLPTLLETVRVSGDAHCPRRGDRAAALALREQARAGLLTSVVARETRRGRIVRLNFERDFGGQDRIERQTVRIDSTERAGTWGAALQARDFVRDGFVQAADEETFYGPDADVLLDDAFASGYCFHLRGRERDRPNQLGLAFVPASRRNRRVDVDGTLWIDTAQRRIIEIEFRYLGLGADADAMRAGGRVSFWEMPNGVTFVSRWVLRFPSVRTDTSWTREGHRQVRLWVIPREVGGEVATAVWPGGHAYHGDLGAFNGRAVDARGAPVRGGVIRLMDTDYIASPDAQGFFEFFNLLPGPYYATVIREELMPLGIALPAALRFVAGRDSVVQQQMLVPDAGPHLLPHCSGSPESAAVSPWITGRVLDGDGAPVAGALWEIRKHSELPWERVSESRRTDASGVIRSCLRYARGDLVEVRAWRPGEPPRVEFRRLTRQGTSVVVALP